MASGAEEMLRSLEKECPNFIFIDHNMPRTSAPKLMSRLRVLQCFDNSRTVVYSNYIPEKEEAQCRALGAHDCWEKTADYNKLCDKLSHLISETY